MENNLYSFDSILTSINYNNPENSNNLILNTIDFIMLYNNTAEDYSASGSNSTIPIDTYGNRKFFTVMFFSLNLLSVIMNCILLLILKKHSPFMKIFRRTIYAEGCHYFCLSVLFGEELVRNSGLGSLIIQIAKGNIFFLYEQDYYSLENHMFMINSTLIFATQTYTFIMHICIFIELILTLLYPIGKADIRIEGYLYISFIVSALIFFVNFGKRLTNNIDDIRLNFKYTIFFLTSLYLLMVFLGCLNIIVSIRRLGCKKFFKLTFYNKYLLQESLMTSSYFILTSTYIALLFGIVYYNKTIYPHWFVCLSMAMYFSVGIVQFFFRVLDSSFYSKIRRFLKSKIFCCFFNNQLGETTIDKSREDVSIILQIIILNNITYYSFTYIK